MAKKLTINDVSIGQTVLFNNNKEKLKVTITAMNKPRHIIDVVHKGIVTYLLPSDFINGYIYKV